MTTPHPPVFVERFELAVHEIDVAGWGRLRVPVVSGWVEIQMAFDRVPDRDGRRSFFERLSAECASLRTALPDLRWYFLHKPPGLKLRFRVGTAAGGMLERLVRSVAGWQLDGLRFAALGSVFDQAELCPQAFRDDAERLLTLAADAHLAAALADRGASRSAWASFLVRLLGEIGLDDWLAHEALSRLVRLRSVDVVAPPGDDDVALHDPFVLLERPLGPFGPGFAASVALLQVLNLVFNVWGLDARTQLTVLDLARAMTRPVLLADR